MTDSATSGLDQFREIETGEAFTVQNQHLVKVELAATTIMARSGAMVAYQGDVRFEHKGGGMSRPAARGRCSLPTWRCSSTSSGCRTRR